jgi:hypothetical protein
VNAEKTDLTLFFSKGVNEMKKIFPLVLTMVILAVSGCFASFPAKYDPKFSMNPQLGKNRQVNTTIRIQGSNNDNVSRKLQELVDQRIEKWGFTKGNEGKQLDITVKNFGEKGDTILVWGTAVPCALSLFVFPGIAIDRYRMTVVVTGEGSDPIKLEYNSSITSYVQILLMIWGVIAFPPERALCSAVADMTDHLMNDLAKM